MRIPRKLQWGAASNARAVENARGAAVECSRRRVEAADVDLYLRRLAESRDDAAQHLA